MGKLQFGSYVRSLLSTHHSNQQMEQERLKRFDCSRCITDTKMHVKAKLIFHCYLLFCMNHQNHRPNTLQFGYANCITLYRTLSSSLLSSVFFSLVHGLLLFIVGCVFFLFVSVILHFSLVLIVSHYFLFSFWHF